MMHFTSERGSRRHLTIDEVTAYADAVVTPEDRPRIEAHLADCDRCRDELVAVRRTVLSQGEPRPAFWRRSGVRVAGLAAAAVLAGLLLFGPAALTVDEPPIRRGPDATDIAGQEWLEVVAPIDGAQLSGDLLRFEWRAAGPNAIYELMLTDEVGDVVTDTTTRDTILLVPTRGSMHEGGAFFWFVDALLDDGSAVSSRVRRLEVSPSR